MKHRIIHTLLIAIILSACAPIPAPTPTLTPTPGTGNWQVTTDTSTIDDSQTVTLALDADSEIQGWLDKFLPTLIIRCKEHKIDVYIFTGTPTLVESETDISTVRVRFDKEDAQTLKMDNSTNGKSLFFQDPQAILYSGILTHKTMIFEFTPFNASPDNTSFDLHGINEAITPLKKSCSL